MRPVRAPPTTTLRECSKCSNTYVIKGPTDSCNACGFDGQSTSEERARSREAAETALQAGIEAKRRSESEKINANVNMQESKERQAIARAESTAAVRVRVREEGCAPALAVPTRRGQDGT
jgi:hypothetical protein